MKKLKNLINSRITNNKNTIFIIIKHIILLAALTLPVFLIAYYYIKLNIPYIGDSSSDITQNFKRTVAVLYNVVKLGSKPHSLDIQNPTFLITVNDTITRLVFESKSSLSLIKTLAPNTNLNISISHIIILLMLSKIYKYILILFKKNLSYFFLIFKYNFVQILYFQ